MMIKAIKIRRLLIFISLFVVSFSCSTTVVTERTYTNQWLVDHDEIFLRDEVGQLILPITFPHYEPASRGVGIWGSEMTIGIKLGNEYRAYPEHIMRWHEVINDDIDDQYFSVVYCPLTAAGMAWSRNDSLPIGAANMVYNSGHLVYAYSIDIFWLPLTQQCIYGSQVTQKTANIRYIETSQSTWRGMYPSSQILTEESGFLYNYNDDPYPHYSVDDAMLLYPISNYDNRLPGKDKVYTIIFDGGAKAYPMMLFPDSIIIINDTIDSQPVVIAGSLAKQLVVSFYSRLSDSTELTFDLIQNGLPAILIDNEGTIWDVFGYGISGPRAGQYLQVCRSYRAYWFAVAAVYPDIEIYQP
jgi:hypothetical protein